MGGNRGATPYPGQKYTIIINMCSQSQAKSHEQNSNVSVVALGMNWDHAAIRREKSRDVKLREGD